MSTRLSRWGHSCIRLDRGDDHLVIDPGGFSDVSGALDGVAAVLVTHEHPDHLATEPVVAAGVDVWGPQAALDLLAAAGAPGDRLHAVAAGDSIQAGGFQVAVLGEWHALIHADIPRAPNVGYLVEGVLHPGDGYVDPLGASVDALLTPVGGPWLKVGEVVDYVRSVAPRRLVAIHDAHLSAPGLALASTLLGRLGGAGDVILLDAGDGIDL
ncbi:MBL fold metallo-hydrolase [Cellulomonas sp. URHE0023]|uniref:MBL fold metallo-hydrolase n=1 Tax=Cellulomonas sp. URHE0023 TaxID=1380354 RepID=UPI000489D1CB|nr:MBL fold metallo-hydrolase [Cellulomonas sp. URHE0023]